MLKAAATNTTAPNPVPATSTQASHACNKPCARNHSKPDWLPVTFGTLASPHPALLTAPMRSTVRQAHTMLTASIRRTV